MPAVGTIANQGYMKLSWSNEIGYFTDLAGGKGFTISLQQWIKDGAPAPQVAKRIPGDSFSKTNISPTIAYKSPLVSRNITFNEWVAAGMPSPSVTVVAQAATGDPRSIARSMLASYGWADSQFSCLDSLWQKESGWNYRAMNPSSGAYGIPQSLPASKMATAGADYLTNPATQIRWGLGYIKDRYGSPCAAWSHSVAVNWY
ncbi:transglycosylase SLT domain-containing protein [Micrococcales bacterium 31B]|nr:transglycosylase SLT domain-containing protein [Micrococcales bacterium 31B]